MGAATKRLKIDTSDLSDETKRSLNLMPQLQQNVAAESAAAAESGISHRELRKVLTDIGNTAAPGAGRAMGELAMGPLGAALALLSAYELLKKSLDDDSEAADKLAEELAKPDTAGIKGVQEAWDTATKSYGEYLAKLKNAGADNDPIKTEIDRAKELTVAKLEAQKKIQEAMGDKAGAAYTQESIDKTKGSSGLIAEQDQREKAQKVLEQKASEASVAQMQADKKAKDDAARLDKARAITDPNSDAGKALQKKIDEAGERVEQAKKMDDVTTTTSPTGGVVVTDNTAAKAKAISDATNDQQAAQREYASQKKIKEDLEASEIQRDKDKAEADQNASNTEAAATENKKRLTQLPGEIKQDSAKEDIEAHTTKVTEILNEHGGQQNKTLQDLAKSAGYSQAAALATVERIIAGQDTLCRAHGRAGAKNQPDPCEQ